MTKNNNGIIYRKELAQIFSSMPREQMIYVCAPAGYGKTIAVRQLLDSDVHARATMPLDEYDNDAERFCERFCASLSLCQPRNTALAEIVSHPAFQGVPEEFTLRAIAALSVRKHTIFVIDDLHNITDESVLRLLLLFLKRLPDNFRLVIISRGNLPLCFSELLIRGRLARITADQLRFSAEEILQLYKERGKPITEIQAGEILRYTGGWPIGVNALLLSGDEPSGECLDYLEGFIRASIWEKWDNETREFLLCTAAASELYPSLCNALTDTDDGEKKLLELMRQGAFIFRSGDGAYHYHNLFHQFLRGVLAERGDEYVFPLLEKEGRWHLSRRDFYRAADCFIRCKSQSGIALFFDLLESDSRKEFIIEKLLPIIESPEFSEIADRLPYMLSVMAWAAFAAGKPDTMIYYADKFYTRQPDILQTDPCHSHYIFLMYLIDFRVSLRDIARVAAVSAFPGGVCRRGSLAMNMPLLHRGTRDFSELAAGDTEMRVMKIKGVIGGLFGEELEMLAGSMTAGLLYERGELERAYTHALAANAGIKKHFAPESKFCAMSALAAILDAQGLQEEAELVLGRIAAMLEEDRAYYLNNNFKALSVRRKLSNGDTEAARDWLISQGASPYDGVSLHGIYTAFTTCRAYITSGDYDSAAILLAKLLELAETYKRPLDIIEAHILLSVTYLRKKRASQVEAMRHLECAAAAAYSYGHTQLFANEGAELGGLLRRLQGSAAQRSESFDVPVSFIKMLYLKTLGQQGGGLTSGLAERRAKYTDKQMTVMRLICEGKSYREITDYMGIKLPTLRSHIALVYKKLDVTNEIDAVKRITSLGLLEDMRRPGDI